MSHLNVRYSRDMRNRAKREGKGLFTFDWVDCCGNRVTLQGSAGPKVLAYIQHALKTAGMKEN